MTEGSIRRKKELRASINDLNIKCEKAQLQTKVTLKNLKNQLDEEAYFADRQEFVASTLQEFDNLDPSSLDIIFEYKADDMLLQKEEIRQGQEW